jgi:hypothetical protein
MKLLNKKPSICSYVPAPCELLELDMSSSFNFTGGAVDIAYTRILLTVKKYRPLIHKSDLLNYHFDFKLLTI